MPGAFTPTCSMKHLPGFVEKAADIKAKGVDEIVCMAVNDAFVMGAWGDDQKAHGKVRMVADGNGEFTKALGLELDASGFGMGQRSQRFALIAKDGKVTKLLVEPGPGLNASSAESVLEQPVRHRGGRALPVRRYRCTRGRSGSIAGATRSSR